MSHKAPFQPSLLALLVLLPGFPLWASAEVFDPRNEIGFYIETYGELTPEQDIQVALAHRVFKRVRAVADKSSKRLPKLMVVGDSARTWAIALPDGHVVMSRAALVVCHRQATVQEAETRVAFVLGHELAHLARDDFWHQEVHTFLAVPSATGKTPRRAMPMQERRDRELAADDRGFIYAAMAGYPVRSILRPTPHNASDFFRFWLANTDAWARPDYPTTGEREALLKRRLNRIQQKLQFFHFGVRLGHFGYCDDAVYFFREFQKTYPGREVHSNLGFCYLQLARHAMGAERANFYWLPLVLDTDAGAPGAARGATASLKSLAQGIPDRAKGYLADAIEYLELAVRSDPSYLPAHINLATAYLYMGKPHRAQALLTDAQTLAKNALEMEMLQAIALYEQSDSGLDLWPNAVERLERLVANAPAFLEARYNLARLLEVRPRPGAARAHWNALAKEAQMLPASIRTLVCEEQNISQYDQCESIQRRRAAAPPWQWPLRVTGFQTLSSSTQRAKLSGWRRQSFDWVTAKLSGQLYARPNGEAEVLVLDEFVQMQVLRSPAVRLQRLADYCPWPLGKRTVARGTVWSCDQWAALTRVDMVEELWWVAR